MLCSFALFVSSFVSIGPGKPHWGSGQLRYVCSIYLTVWLQVVQQMCSAAAFVVVVVVVTAVGRLLSVLLELLEFLFSLKDKNSQIQPN